MAGIDTIDCQMYDCTGTATVAIRNFFFFHEFVISCRNPVSVYRCDHTMSTDFLYICYPVNIQFLAIGFLQTDTDRMCAVTLCQCRILQQLFFLFRIYRMSGLNRTAAGCTICSMNSADFKYPLRNCSCLVEDNRARFRKCFQIVGTFYQNTLCTGTSDSCKKAERNTDNQRTRAADNQKCQCTVNPDAPVCQKSHKQHADKRWQYCQCQRAVADCRCIVMRKSGNKILGT